MKGMFNKAKVAWAALVLGFAWGPTVLAQQPETAVETATVIAGQSSPVVRLPGTIISRRDAEISAELSGRLTRVAEVGDWLEQGEPIAVIDDHLLQLDLRNNEADVARTEADIDYNRRQINRLRQLATKNNTAQSELDAAESRLEMLVQDLRIAEARRDRTLYDIRRTRVTAPFSGMVVSRSMNTGEYTETGAALLRLVDTQSLEISVNAPMRVARFSHPEAQIHVETDEGQVMTTIRGVIPVGDPRSRMMELRLRLLAGKGYIGEAVTVELPNGQSESSLSIPRDALVLRRDGAFVFRIADDKTATKVPVTAGAGRGARIAVQGNLAVGDQVVIRGAERLREGQAVKVLEQKLAAY